MTIIESALVVLKSSGRKMSIQEIYQEIVNKSLYVFHAQSPINVLRGEIRRHSVGIDFPSASPQKFFFYDETNGSFSVLKERITDNRVTSSNYLSDIRRIYDLYVKEFRNNTLSLLKKMNPYDFEFFCRNLLKTYGFCNVVVTQKSHDGGIDGYGKLKVGLSHMNVAFQCKRWDSTPIGRKEIDAFRGAIQGEFEQGIFFTTSSFSRESATSSIKKGAVPIILIDGNMIVDFMIEKRFGIEHEDLPIFVNALDKIFD